MYRIAKITLVGLLLVGILAVGVFALASGPPSDDSFIRISTGSTDLNFDGDDLSVVGSQASCNPTDITYLQWDLSDISDSETVATAELTLTATSVSGVTPSTTISLHKTADGWDEASLTGDNAPAVGDLLDSKTAPQSTTPGENTVMFDAAAIATYVDEAVANDVVSFAVQTDTNCDSFLTRLGFGTKGAAGALSAQQADAPDLQLRNPNSVTLNTFSANNTQSVNWALYVGLAGLAVLVLGAVGYGYSRTR